MITFPAKVTPEEADRIIRDYAFGREPSSKVAKIQRPIVPGSVGHYLFRKEGEAIVRHGVIGQLRAPNPQSQLKPWWVAYVSLRDGREAGMTGLNVLGRGITYAGPGGSIHILPRRLKSIEESILPAQRIYIGCDWMEAEQPTQEDIECGLAGLVEAMDAFV